MTDAWAAFYLVDTCLTGARIDFLYEARLLRHRVGSRSSRIKTRLNGRTTPSRLLRFRHDLNGELLPRAVWNSIGRQAQPFPSLALRRMMADGVR